MFATKVVYLIFSLIAIARSVIVVTNQSEYDAWSDALPGETYHQLVEPNSASQNATVQAITNDGEVYATFTLTLNGTASQWYEEVTARWIAMEEAVAAGENACPLQVGYNEQDCSTLDSNSTSTLSNLYSASTLSKRYSIINNCGWWCRNSPQCSGLTTKCHKCKSLRQGWRKHCLLSCN